MRRSNRWLLALALVGCDADEDAGVAAICEGDTVTQLIAMDTARSFWVETTRDSAVLHVDEQADRATYIGRGCGADAVRVLDGAWMRVARVHLDPADDDPALACMIHENRFLRLDPRGVRAPTLLLPHLECAFATPTAHGVLVRADANGLGDGAWWLLPDFPSEAGAVRLGVGYSPLARGDTFYYVSEGHVHVYDARVGVALPLVPDVDDYTVNDTHLLWRAAGRDVPVPMHLLDLATGARVQLGDFDPAIDDPALAFRPWDTGSWSFDHDGAHVLHVPADPEASGEAYDLRGERLSLPIAGAVFASLPGGHVVTEHEPTGALYAARPGDAAAARLDVAPREDGLLPLVVVDDHLETVEADQLREVPLDGGPARVLVADVGVSRHWLGPHLVTVFAGDLTSIDTRSGARTVHAGHVLHSSPAADGRGVYFMISRAPGDPQNGLWYLPVTALAP